MDLPDNPAVNEKTFTFDKQIDLLDYCWHTACDVVRCIETTLPQVFELDMLGKEPSKWYWLTDA